MTLIDDITAFHFHYLNSFTARLHCNTENKETRSRPRYPFKGADSQWCYCCADS